MVKYGNERPPILSGCPPTFAEVIKKCWAGAPHERPKASEVLYMLENATSLPNQTPDMALRSKSSKSHQFISNISIINMLFQPTLKSTEKDCLHVCPKLAFEGSPTLLPYLLDQLQSMYLLLSSLCGLPCQHQTIAIQATCW